MLREILIWFVLLVFSIINSISVALGHDTLFNISLWLSWVLVAVMTVIIVVIRLFRKSIRAKYRFEQDIADDLNLEPNAYFFQLPLYIIADQKMPVYGVEKITFTPTYFNYLHRFISLFGFSSLYSTYVISESNEVKIVLINPFSLRYQYNVYLNNEYIGIFEMKRLFKDKGIKQQLPYVFKSREQQYFFNNDYMSAITTISDANDNVVFQANRSFMDFSKSSQTQQRGEKHNVTLYDSEQCIELLLALYIQAMINKHTQK
ncbi:Uncharacterised protein [Staphylococcus microti]|nr:hypothetical protein [Staphylococcus microti]SUM57250.1 Uncharacterised protein [Staphylococcus microti]